MNIYNLFIDGFFICDIFVTFFSVVEIKGGNFLTKHRDIAKTYLVSWFWIDVGSSIPFDIVEMTGSNDSKQSQMKLLRLMRLPRLFRIVKLIKIMRIMKFLR